VHLDEAVVQASYIIDDRGCIDSTEVAVCIDTEMIVKEFDLSAAVLILNDTILSELVARYPELDNACGPAEANGS